MASGVTGAGRQDARSTRATGSTVRLRYRRPGCPSRSNTRCAASVPSALGSWSITVIAGSSMSAMGKSPNPTMARPCSRSAGTSAIEERALDDMIAVGGSASSMSLRSTPEALPRSSAPCTSWSGFSAIPASARAAR